MNNDTQSPRVLASLIVSSLFSLAGCPLSTFGITEGYTEISTGSSGGTTGDPTSTSSPETTTGGSTGNPSTTLIGSTGTTAADMMETTGSTDLPGSTGADTGTTGPEECLSPDPMAPGGSAVHIVPLGGGGDQFAYDVAFDEAGNVYVAGTFRGTLELPGKTLIGSASQYALFVAKFCGGALEWAIQSRQVDGTGSGEALALTVSDGPEPSVWITGFYSGSIEFDGFGALPNQPDGTAYVMRLDHAGTVLGALDLGPDPEAGLAVALHAGAVYVSGQCEHDPTMRAGLLLAQLTTDLMTAPNVHCLYSDAPPLGVFSVAARSIVPASDGDLLVSGVYHGAFPEIPGALAVKGITDGFMAKLSPDLKNLQWNWFRRLQSGDEVSSVYVEVVRETVVPANSTTFFAAGWMLEAGQLAGCNLTPGAFVAQLDNAGQCQKSWTFGPPVALVQGIAAASDRLYITGEFNEQLQIPPKSLIEKGATLFAAALNPVDAAALWAVTTDHSDVMSNTPASAGYRLAAGSKGLAVIGLARDKGIKFEQTEVGTGTDRDSFLLLLNP